MKYAPVVLFAYARPVHTSRTLEALAANHLADQTDLIVYADGARGQGDAEGIAAVRALLQLDRGFRNCSVVERPSNYGLARNIIEGVTEVCNRHGRVIVLEEDMVTSPCFLSYMNEALVKFATDERIASIHGYVYPVSKSLPQAFFLRGADCWGWATWSRAWRYFNPDGMYLLEELRRLNLTNEFDFHGAYPFSRMLAKQIIGKLDSWAIRWHASMFLKGMLTLYPGHSLVQNIGFDGSGYHCGISNRYMAELSPYVPRLDGLKIEASQDAAAIIEAYFRQTHGISASRLWHSLCRLVRR